MGEVGNAGRWEVGRDDGEVLRKSVELDDIGWGDAGRREVRRGDGEVLGRSVELGGAERSPEVNYEARRAKSMSITGDVEWGEENRKTFSTNLTCRDAKIFVRVGSKQRKAL